MAGKVEFADRLMGDLVADAARLRATGWTSIETTEEALAAAARGHDRELSPNSARH
jgi:hypothetical protein